MLVALAALPVVSLRARVHDLRDDWPLTLLGLGLLLTATVLVCRRGTVARWAAFVLAALFWLAVDGPLEGPTVLRFVPRHGFTVGDLLPIALGAAAAALGVRRNRVGAG